MRKPITPQSMKELAGRFAKIVYDHIGYEETLRIWVPYPENPKCSDCYRMTKDGGLEIETREDDVEEHVEYFNRETMTATFEDMLYEILNDPFHPLYDGLNNDINWLIAQYGLYYDQGHPWSIALYENFD